MDVSWWDSLKMGYQDKVKTAKKQLKLAQVQGRIRKDDFREAEDKRLQCATCKHMMVMKFPPGLIRGVSDEWVDALNRISMNVKPVNGPLDEIESRLNDHEVVCGLLQPNSPLKWSEVDLPCASREPQKPRRRLKTLVNDGE